MIQFVRKRLAPVRLGVAALIVVAVLGVGSEIAARLLGLDSVPLFQADNSIGYVPAPGQAGVFLGRVKWAFNSISMGTDLEFSPSAENVDVLLIGDSIVYGGNQFLREERLDAQLAKLTGAQVWPASAPSWSLQNELEYLRRHPEVTAGVDRTVFVLNEGDFGAPSSWSSEYTHPLARPRSALWFAVGRYFLKPPGRTPTDLMVATEDWSSAFSEWEKLSGKPVLIVLYRSRPGSPDDGLAVGERQLSGPQLTMTTYSAPPEFYSDYLHPTSAGTKRLAEYIANLIR